MYVRYLSVIIALLFLMVGAETIQAQPVQGDQSGSNEIPLIPGSMSPQNHPLRNMAPSEAPPPASKDGRIRGYMKKPEFPKQGPVYQDLSNGVTVKLVKQDVIAKGDTLVIEDRGGGLSSLEILTGLVALLLAMALLGQSLILMLRSSMKMEMRIPLIFTFIIFAAGLIIAVYILGSERSYRQWCEYSGKAGTIACKESRWMGLWEKSLRVIEVSKDNGGLFVYDLPRPRKSTAVASVPEYVLFYSENRGQDRIELTQDIGDYKTLFQVGQYISDLMSIELADTPLRTMNPVKPKSGKTYRLNNTDKDAELIKKPTEPEMPVEEKK